MCLINEDGYRTREKGEEGDHLPIWLRLNKHIEPEEEKHGDVRDLGVTCPLLSSEYRITREL